jgi:hypothetical protein
MAKVSRTPKRGRGSSDTPSDPPESIFDHFAQYNPGMVPETATRKTEKSDTDVSRDILDRLARLEGENAALRDTVSRPQYAAPRQEGPTGTVDLAKMKVDLSGLPDPVDKPAEHAAELQARMNAALDARTHALRSEFQGQTSQSQAAERLWSNFADAYPEHAKHRDRVEFIATKVAEEANARGIDLNSYLHGSTKFIDDVAKRMNDTFGGYDDDDDDDGDDTPTGQRHGAPMRQGLDRDDDDDDDGRTAGIAGGIESGGAPSAGRQKPKSGDMIADIQDIQRRSGFF